MKTIKVCSVFLEWKLKTKEGTANERTHSFMFIKFIKKNWKKQQQWNSRWEKMSKATEENKLIMIKILLWELNYIHLQFS